MKQLAILGAGESGAGTAILAKQKGWEVFVSDNGPIADKYKEQLTAHDIAFEERGHTLERILNADEIVKSPGIADETPIMQAVIGRGIPVLAEIEFAAPYSRARHICITGSNGKTTTTTLIHHILKEAGLDASLAGNIGRSYARQVAEGDHDWYVVELSSFQLDNMYSFRPDISVLMNITPDHLDRYAGRYELYAASKMRIIQNQTPRDTFIYWREDPLIHTLLHELREGYAPVPTPSSKAPAAGRPSIQSFRDVDFQRLGLTFPHPGLHNRRNAVAAYRACRKAGVGREAIRESLKTFPGVPHRLESVGEKGGVLYINDSKATNVDACRVALEAMERPVVLIVGGKDKGNDYSTIAPLIKERCRAIVYLGADNTVPMAALDGLGLPSADTHDIVTCVREATRLAKSGDVVLLSPCCASFDLFNGMAERGNKFREAVKAL